jgi:acyl dehydratase
MPRYLEDFHHGDVIELGEFSLAKDEIIAFAKRFDPQPFHVDEEAAKQTHFGGLIASGWHTVSALMRLMVDGYIKTTVSLGSPGIDEIRWLKPVRPGDVLRARGIVLEVVPSRSKPDRGHTRIRYEVENQKGETVMTMVGRGIFARRPPD